MGLKYAKNALAAGAPPGPAGEAHDAPADPLVGWGGGPPILTPSAPWSSRLRRSAAVPPSVKSWLRHWHWDRIVGDRLQGCNPKLISRVFSPVPFVPLTSFPSPFSLSVFDAGSHFPAVSRQIQLMDLLSADNFFIGEERHLQSPDTFSGLQHTTQYVFPPSISCKRFLTTDVVPCLLNEIWKFMLKFKQMWLFLNVLHVTCIHLLNSMRLFSHFNSWSISIPKTRR